MTSLKRLTPYLKPHTRSIILALACTLLSGALDGAFLYLAQYVLKPILSGNGDTHRQMELAKFAGLILSVAIFRVLVSFGQTYITQRTGQRILAKIREDLFAKFSQLSVSFFERKRTGEAISRLTNDVNALQAILTTLATGLIGAPVALVICIGYMLSHNWRLTLFVVFILPVAAWLINRAGRRIRAATAYLSEKNADLTNYLQEKLAAMRLIQTFGTEEYEQTLFRKVNDAAYKSTMKPIRIQASLAPIIEFTGMCGIVSALWFGGNDVVHGRMQAEALITFLLAIHRSAMQAKAIAGLNLLVKSAEAAAGRLWEIIDTQPDVRDSANPIDLGQRKVEGHLKFEKVRFAYQDGPEILHDIEFEIKPGEVVALAGLTGSGKTTIASLVPRLYDPTSGRVTLDGLDLRDIKLKSLRDLIGAVPQEVTLFHGTIRDNIAYGRPNASLDEVVAAARRAHADEFIRTREGGYDAPIGERGGGFSGGQRQRLAIARALLRDPKLLILDEATSSLDAESEGLVQDALNELMKGRTTLIIAHRFSTIMHADRILVLEQGRVVEEGNHQELLARKGLYARLFQMQAFAARREANEEEAEVEGKLELLPPAPALA
jgi:subfamily B ATP-binding cassette protein MsbA